MLIDGIDLLEGSIVENLTIGSGDGTAQGNLTPSNGEMFYRTDLNEFQVYINGSWNAIGTQGDLANKLDTSLKGATNGVAELDSSGYVPSTQLSGTYNISISGDADTLDGQHGSYYRNASNLNAGTVPSGRLSGTYAIDISGDADTLDGQHGSYYYSPGNPPPASGGPFAFVNFGWNGSSVVIRKSSNVSSVTRISAGRYQVNFSSAAPDNDYIVQVTNSSENDGYVVSPIIHKWRTSSYTPTTSSFQIFIVKWTTDQLRDVEYVNVTVHN